MANRCGRLSAVWPSRSSNVDVAASAAWPRRPQLVSTFTPFNSGLLRNASCCRVGMSPCGIIQRCSPVFMSMAMMRPSGPLKMSGKPASGSSASGLARRRPFAARDGPRRQRLAGHLVVVPLLRRREDRRRAAAGRRDEDHARRRIGRRRTGDVRAAAATRADVRGTLALGVAAMRRRREQRRQQIALLARARAPAS